MTTQRANSAPRACQVLQPPKSAHDISPLIAPPRSPGLQALMADTANLEAADRLTIRDRCRLIAFYLPQYHAIAENDEWWGPGFTEWTNVARARPNFDGHYQPHIPRELGFYDLSHLETLRKQVEMARLYGIHAFCFYHYWFSGRRILEKPMDLFLASDINMPFCICWANENWTRTWDGDTSSILLEQRYLPGEEEAFFSSILPLLHDTRYLRVHGVPLLLVYRPKEIPGVVGIFDKWRSMASREGLGGLHIAAVDFYDVATPGEVGADSLVEFPPHKFNGPGNIPRQIPSFSNRNFSGGIVDYRKVISQSLEKPAPEHMYFRGIMPNWDNTARRQDTPLTVISATPSWYEDWLAYLRAYTRYHSEHEDEQLIFVNAWNEWGEGCHLEPDLQWGLGYLESTFKSGLYNQDDSLERIISTLNEKLQTSLRSESDSEAHGLATETFAAPTSSPTKDKPSWFKWVRDFLRARCRP
jgi:lipopolysaccharide biosynthesis protein